MVVPPWDNGNQTPRTVSIWLMLDEIHDWWLENRDKGYGKSGYSACANHFGVDWRISREKTWVTAILWLRAQEDPDPRNNNRWIMFCKYHGKYN